MPNAHSKKPRSPTDTLVHPDDTLRVQLFEAIDIWFSQLIQLPDSEINSIYAQLGTWGKSLAEFQITDLKLVHRDRLDQLFTFLNEKWTEEFGLPFGYEPEYEKAIQEDMERRSYHQYYF